MRINTFNMYNCRTIVGKVIFNRIKPESCNQSTIIAYLFDFENSDIDVLTIIFKSFS